MATGQSIGTAVTMKLATRLNFRSYLGRGISNCDGTTTTVSL